MKYIHIVIFLIISAKLQAQNLIGLPQIDTYTSLDYKAGTQNWGITQDKNGIIYFANNEGLLAFDGRHWKLYPLPHNTVVRSLKIVNDGKIYVGGQDEIGYFFPDKNGALRYTSIRNLIPENDRHLSDIWEIVTIGKSLFFRTTDKILRYHNNQFEVFKPKQQWEYMGEADGKLYAQDMGIGLMFYENDTWEKAPNHPVFLQDYITSIQKYGKDTLLLSTLKNGFFILGKDFILDKKTESDEVFKQHRVYRTLKISEQTYAVATSSAGCLIIDKNGHIHQKLSADEGLYINKLRSVFLDHNRNLWLGLDDGINFVAFNNAIKYIYPDKEKQTSSYSTLVNQGKLYVGTSNGIYVNPIEPNINDFSLLRHSFTEVKNLRGQTWSLNAVDNKVVAGHEDGAYAIDGNVGHLLYNSPATWLFESLNPDFPDKIIAGTYTGLNLISKQGSSFINEGKIAGVTESMRFVFHDGKVLWASHPYRGVFKFDLSEDLKKITKTTIYGNHKGLPSNLGNVVVKLKDRVIVAAKDGLYEYDIAKDAFKRSDILDRIFGRTVYHYLKEDTSGNIWFVSNKKIGVVHFENPLKLEKFDIIYFPELNSQVVAGFENIYPYNAQNVFIGANKGLIHINFEKYARNLKKINVILSSVKASNKADSILFGGYFVKNSGEILPFQDKNNQVVLEKSFNSLQFEFSSTLYEQQKNIQFSYKLEGFDDDWSEWNTRSEKSYTNLPKGVYVFKVKARNNFGNESSVATYTFEIEPAWYETNYFYFFCFMAFIFTIYAIIKQQQKKHIRAQNLLKKQHDLEIELNKSEIIKLQNEKLETEVIYKNKELATTSMHLVQKNKLLSKIKDGLLPLCDAPLSPEYEDELKKVIRLLNESEKSDSDWEQFSHHFDQIHSNFLTKLKDKFPNLSQNDLKLCAYLKMNLSSKEIAQLLSITIRAVEVSRYRLRKKLQLSSDTNLFDYLYQVTSDE